MALLPLQHQPTELATKQPPQVLVAGLPSTDPEHSITVRESSSFVAPPIDQPRERPDANKLGRANAVRHGYLQDNLRSLIVGELTRKSLVDTWDKGGRYKKICKDIMTELYGPQSALRLRADGEASEEKVLMNITNWSLELAALERFPPAVELADEAASRTDKISELKADIQTLQNDVKRLYQRHYNTASETSAKNSYAQRQKNLWDGLQERTVRPAIAVDTLASARELRSAKLLPLARRERAERIAFWVERVTPDVIASHFGLACAIVDMQAVFELQPYKSLFAKRIPYILDQPHLYLFTPRDLFIRLQAIQNNTAVYAQTRKWDVAWTKNRTAKGRLLCWKDLPAFNSSSHARANCGTGDIREDPITDDEEESRVFGA